MSQPWISPRSPCSRKRSPFLREEAASEGTHAITPCWRLLKEKGELNPKCPGSIPALTTRLNAETHAVHQRGNQFFVTDHAHALIAAPDLISP